jgi:N-acetyltransferase 10
MQNHTDENCFHYYWKQHTLFKSNGNILTSKYMVYTKDAFVEILLILSLNYSYLIRYEGTGRSLSLKLLQQLRAQAVPIGVSADKSKSQSAATGRALHEVS